MNAPDIEIEQPTPPQPNAEDLGLQARLKAKHEALRGMLNINSSR